MTNQSVTMEQLARLYAARNEANKRMSQAMRSKDENIIRLAKEDATRWNYAYDDARKAYKRQQKAKRKADLRTTMIKWYLDRAEVEADEATEETEAAPARSEAS